MSAKPEAADAGDAAKPAKSKKMLIIGLVVVLVLALGGGGAFFYISKQRAAAEEGDGDAPAKAASHAGPKAAPAYLPLDNMVVNLSDPGGERVAQVGITLEVLDAHAADTVKAFLPTIRSGILMLISQRTAEELLPKRASKNWQRTYCGRLHCLSEAERMSMVTALPLPRKRRAPPSQVMGISL